MQWSIFAVGTCVLIAVVSECATISTANYLEYPRTERIYFESVDARIVKCSTTTVFSVSSNKAKTNTGSFFEKLNCQNDTKQGYMDTMEEAFRKCSTTFNACKEVKYRTNPDNFQAHFEEVGNDADQTTLKDYASTIPINTRVDLTDSNVKICKDAYGRYYSVNFFFGEICPMFAYTAEDHKIEKLSPSNPRELRWMIEEKFVNAKNAEVRNDHRKFTDVSYYKDRCVFYPNTIFYICGFEPFSPDDPMPASDEKSLCPGDIFIGKTREIRDYKYSFSNDKINVEDAIIYPKKPKYILISNDSFSDTCYATMDVTIDHVASEKSGIDVAFTFHKKVPPNASDVSGVYSLFEAAIINRQFKNVKNSIKATWQIELAVPANSLERKLEETVSQLFQKKPAPCYYTTFDTCEFMYKPYCDDAHKYNYTSITKTESLKKFGKYLCSRSTHRGGCNDDLARGQVTMKVECQCEDFLCDYFSKQEVIEAVDAINRELEEEQTCNVGINLSVQKTTSKASTFCYMTLTHQPETDTHSLEFGILDMTHHQNIVDNLAQCETLQNMEEALFAPNPRETSCRVTKGTNATMYQCCCRADSTPCNTEPLLQKYFSLQTIMELHSCQFHSHPTGPCAGSRYEQFRCIGVFDVTQNNMLKNAKEDCVSSNQDIDRASALCRRYGNKCTMMAMYNMQKDEKVDETNLPVYVCCSDNYAAFEKKLRTRKLKRISDFVKKK